MFLVGGVDLGEHVQGLLVGELVAGQLVFRGTVEFGVSTALLTELAGSPLVRPASPFADLTRRRGVRWLEPKLTVEVQYNDLTGRRLRAPVLRGLMAAQGDMTPVIGKWAHGARRPSSKAGPPRFGRG